MFPDTFSIQLILNLQQTVGPVRLFPAHQQFTNTLNFEVKADSNWIYHITYAQMPQTINIHPGHPPSNYINPPTRGPGIQITNSIFIFLVVASISLRLYTRISVPARFGLDDLFATIGSVC